MYRGVTEIVTEEDVAFVARCTHLEEAVRTVELEHIPAGAVANDHELPSAVEVELELTVVTADAQVSFAALRAQIEHRKPSVELQHLPARAVDHYQRIADRLGHGALPQSPIRRRPTAPEQRHRAGTEIVSMRPAGQPVKAARSSPQRKSSARA